MNLSSRLQIIYQFILNKGYKSVYDVGSDHGKLAIKLIEAKSNIKVWASDISSEAIKRLIKKTLEQNWKINCLVANGLNKLTKKVDVVVIAGLGQHKILDILKKDTPLVNNYILQTSVNPTKLRSWIRQNNFFLTNELILKEKKHYYHYLFVNKKTGTTIQNNINVVFGPLLQKNKTEEFNQFWQEQKNKWQTIIAKITDYAKQKELIKQVKLINNILKK